MADSDKTKVDPTEAVREAGTGVIHTRSGWRLPDGTLVNHEEDEDGAGSAVDGETTGAVEEAAAQALGDDAPSATSEAGDAVVDATAARIGSARAIDTAFEGQDLSISEEHLAEMIGQTAGDDPAADRFGGIDDLRSRKPGADLLDDEEQAPPEAPFSGRQPGFEAGPDLRQSGVFDLIEDGGAGGDPLSSFLGAVEAKLGRDLGLASPSDAQGDATPFGKDQIADGGNGITVTRGRELKGNSEAGKAIGDALGIETAPYGSQDYRNFIEVKDTNNGTITRVYDNGATTTTTLDGEKIDSTPGLTAPIVSSEPIPAAKTTQEIEEEKKEAEEKKKREEEKKKEEDKKEEEKKEDDKSKQPDPDEEFVVPEELQRQLDGDVARFRGLRNQGPDSGDGATDPSEIDSEVVGSASEVPTHAEIGQSLFGQPDTEAPTGGDSNLNPGADSQGAGVITPGEDQVVPGGPTRNDDPFDAAGTPVKPPSTGDDAGDEATEYFLPPSEIAGPVDDGPEIPDAVLEEPAQ